MDINHEVMITLKKNYQRLEYQLGVAESKNNHTSAIEMKAQMSMLENLWNDLIEIEI